MKRRATRVPVSFVDPLKHRDVGKILRTTRRTLVGKDVPTTRNLTSASSNDESGSRKSSFKVVLPHAYKRARLFIEHAKVVGGDGV